jgi:uncharacterized protein YjlB
MYVVETLKSAVGRITGATRLEPRELRARLRRRKPSTTRFKDDGAIPNNSLPFVLYPGTVDLAGNDDPAAVFEQLFAANGWGDSWRNGIYDYVHYQSRTHEALGIARGSARVRFGGDGGRVVQVQAGDVAVLPAGTGHQCVGASDDFLVVGAYPPTGTYDECRGAPDEHARALLTIPKVRLPRKDPVLGDDGPLLRLWSSARPGRKARAKSRATARAKARASTSTKSRSKARSRSKRPRAAKRRPPARRRAA